MMDRDLSVQEAAKAGRIVIAGGAVLLVFVVYEIARQFSEPDAVGSVLLALALGACVWTIQKGCRLVFGSNRTDELMSIPTLYMMSALMLAFGIFMIVVGHWFNALIYAVIQSVLFFAIAMRLLVLASRRRRSGL